MVSEFLFVRVAQRISVASFPTKVLYWFLRISKLYVNKAARWNLHS